RETFPELERVLVERRALIDQVVGADDGGVAPGVPAAEPALLEHGDVGDAVLLGQKISGGEAVATGADNHHVIARLRVGVPPEPWPTLVPGNSMAHQRKDRVALHRNGSGLVGKNAPGRPDLIRWPFP